MTSDLTPAGWDVRSRSAVARRSSAVPAPPPPPQPPVYYGCVNLYRVLLPTCHCFALRFLGQRWWRWVRTVSRGDARVWLGEAVIKTLNVVFWLYLTSYLAQEDARQLFECRTPSFVLTHHLVVCLLPTTEILTENRLQRGCWVATAGDCTLAPEARYVLLALFFSFFDRIFWHAVLLRGRKMTSRTPFSSP